MTYINKNTEKYELKGSDEVTINELLAGEFIEKGDISCLERLIEVKIETRNYEDVEKLYLENSDNIIGRFIEKTKDLEEKEEFKSMVLEYGLMALSQNGGEIS